MNAAKPRIDSSWGPQGLGRATRHNLLLVFFPRHEKKTLQHFSAGRQAAEQAVGSQIKETLEEALMRSGRVQFGGVTSGLAVFFLLTIPLRCRGPDSIDFVVAAVRQFDQFVPARV